MSARRRSSTPASDTTPVSYTHLDVYKRQELDPRELAPRELDPRELDPRELDPRELDPRALDLRELALRELDLRELERREPTMARNRGGATRASP